MSKAKSSISPVVLMFALAAPSAALAGGADKAQKSLRGVSGQTIQQHDSASFSDTKVIVSGRDDNRSRMVKKSEMEMAADRNKSKTVISQEGVSGDSSASNVGMQSGSAGAAGEGLSKAPAKYKSQGYQGNWGK